MRRRHRLSLLILCLALLTALFLYTPPHRPVPHLSPRSGPIVFFGDSITAGVGSGGEGFVEILQRRTGQPLVNRGNPGITTTGAIDRLQADVLCLNPSLVFVELGGNDYLTNVDTEVTFANLRLIVSRIEAQGARVVLLAIDGGPLTLRYRWGFEELAQSLDTGLVPSLLQGVLSRPDLMVDYIHPNDAGYAKVADNIQRDLQECLSGLGRPTI